MTTKETPMDYYLLFMWGGVDLKLFGPFEDKESRDTRAKELWQKYGNECGYYSVEVTKSSQINIDSYPGSFFEE